jgi:hypothetical protein
VADGDEHVWWLQVYQLDILKGCVGWQPEADPSTAQGAPLCLRYGPLFRLRLFFKGLQESTGQAGQAPAAQGYLELTHPGIPLPHVHAYFSTSQYQWVTCMRVVYARRQY